MIAIKDILAAINYVEFIGNEKTEIAAPIQSTSKVKTPNSIMWVSDKNINQLLNINSGTIICSINTDRSSFNNECNYILVENPRMIFQKMLMKFFVEVEEARISENSNIHPSSLISANVSIGHGVVIEKNCTIGDNVEIGHNTVIMKNTVIEKAVKIGSNCTIGGVGFGYEKDEEGLYQFIPHLGNVVIMENAEIGNCTAIDRAVLGSTLVGKNCKIDNLVHIAHGVQLGNNSLIIANAMVAGSVTIGENVWVAPSSSILNNKSVGDNAVIGMGAVVLKNVDSKQVIVGNPGKPLRFH